MIAKAKKRKAGVPAGRGKPATVFAALPGRHKAAIVLVAVILILIWKRLIY